MKALTLLLIILISGCTLEYADYSAEMQWVYDSIEYKSDVYDEWQLPLDTLVLGTGDCEDMAILFLWRVYTTYGIKGTAVVVIVRDTYQFHMVAEIGGEYYNVTFNAKEEGFDKVIISYNYDMLMIMATLW